MYSEKDIQTGNEVALKVELQESETELHHEYKIYKALAHGPGIPKAYWCGVEGQYNVMVIDRSELSLEDIVRQAPIDRDKVVSFAHQMVST